MKKVLINSKGEIIKSMDVDYKVMYVEGDVHDSFVMEEGNIVKLNDSNAFDKETYEKILKKEAERMEFAEKEKEEFLKKYKKKTK